MANLSISELEKMAHLGDIPEPCPYLPDRIATLRFVNGYLAGLHYRQLLDEGYRRCGLYLYRPVCRGCQECRVLRVPVATFKRSREQRRVWNRAAPLFTGYVSQPSYTPEKADIYRRYLVYQHDEKAQDVTPERYTDFLVESCLGGHTVELQLRAGDRIAGVGILDRAGDALSTVYFYFDPDFAKLSLGTFSALYEIELARRWGLRYYYLGYYIRDCASMRYKSRFRPCEVLEGDSGDWAEWS